MARKRGKGGRFKKGGSKAVAVRRSSPPARRRRRGGGGNPGTSLMARLQGVPLGGAIYGFVKGKTELLKDVPVIDEIGADATFGLAAHFINSQFFKNPWLDKMASAALTIAAAKLGAGGFEFSALKASGDDNGDGDGDKVEGVIDVPAKAVAAVV